MRYLKNYELKVMDKRNKKTVSIYLNKSDYLKILKLPVSNTKKELIKKYKTKISLSEKEYKNLKL
tara:strand:+ start:338 stop:532 length:195 start_codon:yes stop_codon:yes gene_type:complete